MKRPPKLTPAQKAAILGDVTPTSRPAPCLSKLNLGAAKGELIIVEYAITKAVKELRRLADRLEHTAKCTREAWERLT